MFVKPEALVPTFKKKSFKTIRIITATNRGYATRRLLVKKSVKGYSKDGYVKSIGRSCSTHVIKVEATGGTRTHLAVRCEQQISVLASTSLSAQQEGVTVIQINFHDYLRCQAEKGISL